MKNKKLIKQLEQEYRPNQSISVELDLPYGVSETNYHRGTWRGHHFTCTSTVDWRRGRLKTDYMDVSDLIDLLKDKVLDEMSGDDFPDLALVETSDGHVEVSDLEWDEAPTEEELEEMNTNDLYSDSEITDCEYEVAAGGIGSLTITIRKDTLTIDADGHELSLAPRIRKWTEKDKSDFEQRTLAAVAEMADVQSTYELMLESEVDEDLLPRVEVAAGDAPSLRVARFELSTETGEDDEDYICLSVWAENGPAARIRLGGLGDAIRLRNQLARQVDAFGRAYDQRAVVDVAYDPPVDYDFGPEEDAEGSQSGS